MSSTRQVISPGIFAADALTVIPPTPIAGTAYRVDTGLSVNDTERGWPYATTVPSDIHNEILYRLSTLVDIMDRQGMLGWSNLVNYPVGAYVVGSNSVMYKALLINGPATTLQDPTAAPTYWAPVGGPVATLAQARALADSGTVISPQRLGDVFTQGAAGSGRFMRLPGNMEMQWGNVTFGAGSDGADVAVTFPHAFGGAGTINITATVRGVSGLIVGITSNTTSGAVLRISQRSEAAFAAGSIDFCAIGPAA